MRPIALIAALSLCIAGPAVALEGTLRSDTGNVFVWKSKDAFSEALSLIQAGVHRSNPKLLIPLLSCIVPSGTSAITTSAGVLTHDILVTSGDKSGCRGNVPREDFRNPH